MWLWYILASAVLLGLYDVAKKHSLKKNDSLVILLISTGLTVLFLTPWATMGTVQGHLCLLFKAVLVSASWITGMLALEKLPITLVSTFKACRPVLVLIFSIAIYGEMLNLWQWGGSILALVAIWMLSLTGKKEGIDWRHSRGVLYMMIAVLTGVASALWDKYLLGSQFLALDSQFVQFWANVYVTLLLAVIILVRRFVRPGSCKPFRWDWTIPLIAILITAADFLYFYAVHSEGALLSVISMIRRGSVVVTFAVGAILFKEKNIKGKALALATMLVAMLLIVIGSS